MREKVMTMEQAVKDFVKQGDSVFFAGMQHGESVAAIHEIIRQRIDHLTLIPALTLCGGLMIGEGLVDKLVTAFVRDLFDRRNSYTIIKAKENNWYPELEEYSHFGLCLGLMAGEMGIPYLSTKSMLGSDIERHNPNIKRISCPFTGRDLAAVKAINPDVGIIHVQRADQYGNAQKWGSLGMDKAGINASKRVIVTTEEIVDPEVIRRDPNRTIVPGVRVSAVIEEPWGAYPVHLAGCYKSELKAYLAGIEGTGEESYEEYVKEYVYGVRNRRELIEKITAIRGRQYFESLRPRERLFSEPVFTGV